MPEENTTVIVQRYLDELTGEAPAEPAVRGEAGVAAGRRGKLPLAQLHGHRLVIQASGQVTQLPAHVLASQGEELPDGSGTRLAQGLEQPLHHGAEQLVRLEVERRVCQPWVVVVQQRGAEPL